MKNNKNILIAGCEGRVGQATAKLFHENGWNVIGLDIVSESKSSDIDKYISCDIKSEKDVLHAVSSIEEEYGLDALLNTAGYEISSSFEETSIDTWSGLLDTILGGSANLCSAAAPYMVKRHSGKIILLSSDYSKQDGDNIMNSVAAGTLHGFSKSFGVEMAPENVLVNTLSVKTPFVPEAVADAVFYLADKDTYTSAQVISVTGEL